MSRRAGLMLLKVQRFGFLGAAVAAVLAFIAGLVLYGPWLFGFFGNSTPVAALKTFYTLPLGALILTLLAVRPIPVQWYVSREGGVLTIERLRFLVLRDVVDVPAEKIGKYSLRGQSVFVETDGRRHRLLDIPGLALPDGFSEQEAEAFIRELTILRAARFLAEINRVLGRAGDAELTLDETPNRRWAA